MMAAPMLGAFWVAYWVVSLVALAVLFVPLVRILHRAGHSGWWVLLWFVPVANIIGLWVFAFSRWPALDRIHET